MARVSVCMATRNGERFLELQLESILEQLAPEDELVVSDDSSTDGTLGILRGCGDARLRLFPENTYFSPIYNLEHALRQAEGGILVPADQDDIWQPNKLKVVRERLSDRLDRIAAIMMDGDLIDEQGRATGTTLFERFRARKGFWKNLVNNCYTGCSMAFTRPLLQLALPFPPGIPMHDSWLGLLAERYGEMELVPERTIYHRRHRDNTSFQRRNPLRQIAWRWNLARHLWHRRGRVGSPKHC